MQMKTKQSESKKEKIQAFNLQEKHPRRTHTFYYRLSLTQSVLIPPVETGDLRIGLRTDEPSTCLPFQLLGHKRKCSSSLRKAPQKQSLARLSMIHGISTWTRRPVCLCPPTHLYTKEGVVERGKQRTTTCKIEV